MPPCPTASSPRTADRLGSGEGGAEAGQRLVGRAGGPALEGDHAVVAEAAEGGRHRGVVDLAGAGLLPAGDIGDLDLAEVGEGPLDQVPLADLGVVEVEVHPQMRAADSVAVRTISSAP